MDEAREACFWGLGFALDGLDDRGAHDGLGGGCGGAGGRVELVKSAEVLRVTHVAVDALHSKEARMSRGL